ncbi:MAG: Gfo/Idh/MocA family oxidoreductase [Mycobacterium sp.]
MTVRAALVGLGFATQELKLPGYLAEDNVEVVAIADPDPAARAAVAERLGLSDSQQFASYEELITTAEVDYVDVSTPHATHLPIFQLAAASKVSVVCDKPIAMSIAEVDEMIGLVERSGIRAGVHHNYMHFPSHAELIRQARAGAIGRVESVSMGANSIYAPGVMPGDIGWRATARFAGGGILMDYGIHLLYLSLHLLGDDFVPKTVTARADKRRIREDADVEDTVFVHIEGTDGRTATLTLMWGVGTSGYTLVDGTGGTMQIHHANGHAAQHNVADEIRIVHTRDDAGTTVPIEWQRLPLTWYYGGSITSFARYVETGIPTGVATLDEARATVSLALSAYESIALDAPVEVPLVPSSPLYSLGIVGIRDLPISANNVIFSKNLYRRGESTPEDRS